MQPESNKKPISSAK